jgi:hypothetical protein
MVFAVIDEEVFLAQGNDFVPDLVLEIGPQGFILSMS